MQVTEQTMAVQQYLTFFLGGEEYAVSILQVREIIEFGNVTRVPSTPACVRGVINLRGSVLPVIDPSVKFGFIASEPTKQTCIVVVETELDGQSTVIGIMTDAVNQVVELRDEQILPPPSFGTRVHLDFLHGLGQVGEGFVLILNLGRLLTTEELLEATQVPELNSAEQPDISAESPAEDSSVVPHEQGDTGQASAQ
jgi:purine-binding chemotaxis protein CheW